jgi:hypothetical protein
MTHKCGTIQCKGMWRSEQNMEEGAEHWLILEAMHPVAAIRATA